MEKYKYGPLIFVTQGMDEDEGNYYWNGSPPVGYDDSGIPVDKNGKQCLDIKCPLHPGYEAEETFYSSVLGADIPTISSVSKWFDDNFLIVDEKQIKTYIFRWWARAYINSGNYISLLHSYHSVDSIIGAIWQQEERK